MSVATAVHDPACSLCLPPTAEPVVDDLATRVAVRLVQAASNGEAIRAKARRLLEVLHEDPAVCASSLDLVEPNTGRLETVGSAGYRTTTLEYLRSATFHTEDPGYQLLRDHPARPARSWVDVEGYTDSASVTEVFRPCGFTGGATARLVTATGHHVGDLHVSSSDGRSPSPGLVTALGLASRTFAVLFDRAPRAAAVAEAVDPDADAAIVTALGHVLAVPDRPAPPPPILDAVARSLRSADPIDGRYRALMESSWFCVRLVPIHAGVLVLVRRETLPHRLSSRELEVLTHLAGGRSNREIARHLGIAERTVAHHVEHLVAKTGASCRAAAAALAVREGLLLLR